MGIYMYIEKTNVNKEIEELKSNTANLQKQPQPTMDKQDKNESVTNNTVNSNTSNKAVSNNITNSSTSNDVVSNNKNSETSRNEMSIELAYGILNKYKNENLPDVNWYIGKVELIAHGDNNTYWVSYEEKNLDGYTETVGAIIEYKNGKWTTNLPGFSGISDEETSKYNFVNY